MAYQFPRIILESSAKRIERRPYGVYLITEESSTLWRKGADEKLYPVRYRRYHSTPVRAEGENAE